MGKHSAFRGALYSMLTRPSVSRFLLYRFSSFRLYFAGEVSRDIPNGASAAEFQAALMSIKQDVSSSDRRGELVSAKVSLSSNYTGAVAWRITFLSHLEVTHWPIYPQAMCGVLTIDVQETNTAQSQSASAV